MAGKKDRGPKKKVSGTHTYSARGKKVKPRSARQRKKAAKERQARDFAKKAAAQRQRSAAVKKKVAEQRKAGPGLAKPKPSAKKTVLSRDPEYDAWLKKYEESVANDADLDPKRKEQMLGKLIDYGKDIKKS